MNVTLKGFKAVNCEDLTKKIADSYVGDLLAYGMDFEKLDCDFSNEETCKELNTIDRLIRVAIAGDYTHLLQVHTKLYASCNYEDLIPELENTDLDEPNVYYMTIDSFEDAE